MSLSISVLPFTFHKLTTPVVSAMLPGQFFGIGFIGISGIDLR